METLLATVKYFDSLIKRTTLPVDLNGLKEILIGYDNCTEYTIVIDKDYLSNDSVPILDKVSKIVTKVCILWKINGEFCSFLLIMNQKKLQKNT
jgi:hypothetical protein